MKRRKPQIVTVSQRRIDKTAKMKNVAGFTVGNRIYLSPKADDLAREHEVAHFKLGHSPKKMTAYKYARMEVQAEKVARDKLKRKMAKGYLSQVRKDIKERFVETADSKRELSVRAKDAVNKAAKKYGIKHRI